MSKSRSTVTISIHWKGDPESQIYTMPAWLFKTLAVGSVVFAALVALVAVLYTPIARTAARVPGLNTEIARLTEENSQVQQLAATLQELEARYDQIRTVLGAEIIAEPLTTVVERVDRLPILSALVAREPDAESLYGRRGPSLPLYWPVDSLVHGMVTRGFSVAGEGLQPPSRHRRPGSPGNPHPRCGWRNRGGSGFPSGVRSVCFGRSSLWIPDDVWSCVTALGFAGR